MRKIRYDGISQLVKALLMLIFTVALTLGIPLRVSAKQLNHAKVDGIVFVKGDSVTFNEHFFAYKSAKGKGKVEHIGGTYSFQFKDTSGKISPYAFKDKNGKIFYIAEESLPRDYILFTYHPNGGKDKKNKAYSEYSNGNGTYTIPVRMSKAKVVNLANPAAMFTLSVHYIDPGRAWSIGSPKASIFANENLEDFSAYCAGREGPFKINLYANWCEYVDDVGINGTKYLYANPKGYLSSTTLTASELNFPKSIPASEYDWCITKDHAGQGKMKNGSTSMKKAADGSYHLKGFKSIEYYVDETCKYGNNVITVSAGDYKQVFMITTYRWRAHRGNMDRFPENTVESFIGAAESGALSLETDIQPTADGEIVCYHDTNFLIMGYPVDLSYLEINDMDYNEVKTLTYAKGNGLHSANSVANVKRYGEICSNMGVPQDVTQTAKVASFESYLRICKYYGLVPSIELKYKDDSVWTNENLKKVGELLTKYGFNYSNTVVGTFSSTPDLIVRFSKATNYKFTVFNVTADSEDREEDDYVNPSAIKSVDPKITHIGNVTSMLGGEDYKVVSTKEGYNPSYGQTGHDWQSFRGKTCKCNACRGITVKSSVKKPVILEKAPMTLGTTFLKSGIKYKITSIGTKTTNGAVEAVKLESKKNRVSIPNSVIGSDSVKYNVTSISGNFCNANKKVTSISIGASVKEIGKKAFNGCSGIKTVTGCKSVTTIGNQAFSGCKKLTTVKGMKKVKKFGTRAFYNCVALKQIGDKAKKVTMPTVTTIGKEAFSGCKAITMLNCSSAYLKTIGAGAFMKCSRLKSISIYSKKLVNKSIEKNAFQKISSTCVIKVPAGKVISYTNILKKKGVGKKVKVCSLK